MGQSDPIIIMREYRRRLVFAGRQRSEAFALNRWIAGSPADLIWLPAAGRRPAIRSRPALRRPPPPLYYCEPSKLSSLEYKFAATAARKCWQLGGARLGDWQASEPAGVTKTLGRLLKFARGSCNMSIVGRTERLEAAGITANCPTGRRAASGKRYNSLVFVG